MIKEIWENKSYSDIEYEINGFKFKLHKKIINNYFNSIPTSLYTINNELCTKEDIDWLFSVIYGVNNLENCKSFPELIRKMYLCKRYKIDVDDKILKNWLTIIYNRLNGKYVRYRSPNRYDKKIDTTDIKYYDGYFIIYETDFKLTLAELKFVLSNINDIRIETVGMLLSATYYDSVYTYKSTDSLPRYGRYAKLIVVARDIWKK